MSQKPTACEDFELFSATVGEREQNVHTLDDEFPLRGNQPTLFVRNVAGVAGDTLTDAVAADVKVQHSDDRAVWADVATLTVVAGGRAKLAFTTIKKHVRFVLVGDVPNGVRCELIHWHFDPVHQAGV